MQNVISIKGARVHNLKNIDITIPRNALVVITGLSGSGKSSLAFDTLYAEGQRRYIESLSPYAKQFIQQIQKPDVDFIEGLSPSIAIEQKISTTNPRSTIGTITGVYDYLRILFTRIGKPFCYECGSPITTQGTREIIKGVLSLPIKTKIQILSPIVVGRKGEYKKEINDIRRKGFIRARIDGNIVDLTGEINLERYKRHDIDVVIDRIIINEGIEKRLSESIALAMKFSPFVIVNLLEEKKDIIFSKSLTCRKCGISYPDIDAKFFSFNSPHGACPRCRGTGFEGEHEMECITCHGYRLKKEALSFKIGGCHIGEISSLSFKEAFSFFNTLQLNTKEARIAERILKGIKEKVDFLLKIRIGYLTMNRPVHTLSGGEIQRIRIATQLGASLTGVLYIMDEPSIGLHSVDCEALLECLSELRDMDNTVIVVEHDESIIRKADFIIDMGPAAGINGGDVVAKGGTQAILSSNESLTGCYLKKERTIPLPEFRREFKDSITVRQASAFNLKNIDVTFPLGVLTIVTGVSGSGKSTIVFDILYKALSTRLYGLQEQPAAHRSIDGIEKIDKVIQINQSPLGRTPRSNPATYTGLLSHIRLLFASLPESKVRGYSPGRFSFNVPGGRCEACKGEGIIKMVMHFLPDVYVPCEVCEGKRYNKETLDINYKQTNIHRILEMTVTDALDFFHAIPMIRNKLLTLERVGLGYIKLGQPATTLSGGEAQRIKLSKELSKKATGKTLYLLDEPTTGLHFEDIKKLLFILNELVDKGNTVVIIEHNLEVIKNADYIIDLGPGGGPEGGHLVAKGTPEEVACTPESLTGKFLKEKLHHHSGQLIVCG